MPDTKFFPVVSELVPIDKIPDSLGSLQDGVQQLLSRLFYKDFIVEKSENGDKATYKITLVSYKKIEIEFLSTGLFLIFNPDDDDTNISSLKIDFKYSWEVLKYIHNFKSAFSTGDVKLFFDIVLELIDVEQDELLKDIINIFINDPEPIQKFIDHVNTKYLPVTELVLSTTPNVNVFEDLIEQLDLQNIDFSTLIFDDFIGNINSFDEIFDNLKILFERYIGEFDKQDLIDLITPSFSINFKDLKIALAFPDTILKPIDVNGDLINDGSRSMFKYDLGHFAYTSEKGFEFNLVNSFQFTPSQIASTGFTLNVTNAKLDLSRSHNIPEAEADGRPADFIGAYIEEGIIGFPAEWGHNEAGSTGELFVNNLLAGTGGLSGTIGLRAKNAGDPTPLISLKLGEDFAISLDSFSLTFQQNAIIASDIQGTLDLPVKDAAGNNAEVKILIHIGQNGEFNVTANEPDGFAIKLGNIGEIKSSSFSSLYNKSLFARVYKLLCVSPLQTSFQSYSSEFLITLFH